MPSWRAGEEEKVSVQRNPTLPLAVLPFELCCPVPRLRLMPLAG